MRGHLGLGSNEGDRLAALRAARDALDGWPGIALAAASSVYETAPQGEVPDQQDFLNAVLAIDTELAPEEVLDICKQVERELGRAPGACATGRGPSTWTCWRSVTSNAGASGWCFHTPRSHPAASCSSPSRARARSQPSRAGLRWLPCSTPCATNM